VRQYLKEGRIPELKDLVPPTTFEFLVSPEGEPIIEKIKNKE
jgi:[citrate (pro-3S)-lyase] ligase